MRTVVHLSDIHFGSVDRAVIDPLIRAITDVRPDVVAVSGDLTQRARSHQFKEARQFLDALPQPQIIVPGNHDIPLYNLFLRFVRPLQGYRRYITEEMNPSYADDEIVVSGTNTARSLTFKGGRINREQVARLRERFCAVGPEVIKIVVTHHPFDLPAGRNERDILGRAGMALKELSACGVDVFLAGHLHRSHIGHTKMRYKLAGHMSLVVQAGTASSTRSRGESNSFNVIRVARSEISIERMAWQPSESTFAPGGIDRFRRVGAGWSRV